MGSPTRLNRTVDPHVAGTATGVSYRTIRRLVARGELTNHGQPRGARKIIMVDLDEVLDLLGDPHGLR